MNILIIFLGITLLIRLKNKRIDKASKRILLIFIIYWFISLYLATQQIYDFNKVQTTTIIIQLISIYSFIFGFLKVKINPNIQFNLKTPQFQSQVDRIMNNPLFILLLIVTTAYVISLFSIFYKSILWEGSMNIVRNAYYDDSLFGKWFRYINLFLLSPFYTVLTPLFSYYTIYKRNWIWFLSLISLIIYSSLSGGRVEYIRILLPIILIGTILTNKDSLKFNKIAVYTFFTVLVLVLMSYISSSRYGNIEFNKENLTRGFERTTENVVSYSVGATVAFDYSLQHNYLDQIGGPKFGMLTLSGVENIFFLASHAIDMPYNRPSDKFFTLKSDQISISTESPNWNALYSWNFYFYHDFWIFGVIVFPFLFGYLLRRVLIKFYRTHNINYFVILSILFYIVIFSVFDISFITSPGNIILLVVLLRISRRKSLAVKNV